MEINNDDIRLWYGTPDAPAPVEAVSADTKLTVTMGVEPVDASNEVAVRYRVNQGPAVTLAASHLPLAGGSRAQYFRATLPAFQSGDKVEYTPICHCAGRQVPSPPDAQQFAASFRVVEAGAIVTTKSASIKTAVKQDLSGANSASPSPPENPQPGSGNTQLNPIPEQYSITGSIIPPEGSDRAGIKVQAFDRDLPSLERRSGSAPQMLGEAIADSDGRFQITYTIEQFQGGEGNSTFRWGQEKNADLSFRVFDSTGQELNIKRIEALDNEYRSDQIIFNAPTLMDPVSIFVDAPQASGDSEYERLIALIAPVLEDLPLVELSDEDVSFLSNELGLDQKPCTLLITCDNTNRAQQYLEWLRRCARCWPSKLICPLKPFMAGAARTYLLC